MLKQLNDGTYDLKFAEEENVSILRRQMDDIDGRNNIDTACNPINCQDDVRAQVEGLQVGELVWLYNIQRASRFLPAPAYHVMKGFFDIIYRMGRKPKVAHFNRLPHMLETTKIESPKCNKSYRSVSS